MLNFKVVRSKRNIALSVFDFQDVLKNLFYFYFILFLIKCITRTERIQSMLNDNKLYIYDLSR